MSDNPLSAKITADTTDFKTNIAALNREIRVVESGFRASAAALGDWANDASGLEQRISTLNRTIDLQGQKVAATRAEYERIKEEKGENSRAAQDLEIKLNRETETLNKMTRELGETEQNLNDLQSGSEDAAESVEDLGESSEGATGGLETLGAVASGTWQALQVGIGVLVGLAGSVIALTGLIGGLVFSTAAESAELVDMAAKTGISTTRLQELAYVGDQVGTSSDTITGSLARLIRSMSGAQDQYADYSEAQAEAAANGEEFDGQLGDKAAAFERLGVRVTDATGNLRDSETVFAELITALGSVENASERDALAMSIFGKSALELNPLIKAGSEELARLADEAHEVGAVMSEEDVAAFEAFDDTLASLQAGLKGTLGTLAGAFLPGFQDVFNQAGGYLKEFAGIVKESDGDFGKMSTGITGLLQKIITDLAAQGPQYLQGGLTILTGILDAIIQSLPGMLPVAMQMIQALIDFLVTSLPVLMDAGVQILLMLITGLVSGLPALVEAALLMIITLVQGLAQAMPTLIPMIATIIPQIVLILLDNLPLLIEAALQLILALAQGLVAALPILIPAIPVIVQAIFDALIVALPMIATAAGELIATLAMGMIAAIPGVINAVMQITASIRDFFFNSGPSMLEIGKAIVDGIWRGIQNQKAAFMANIRAFFADLINTVKDSIGWHSPAAVFVPGGESIPQAFSVGIKKGMPELDRDLRQAMFGLQRTVDISANVSTETPRAGNGGLRPSISFGDIIVDARGAKDPQAVGRAVGDGLVDRLRSLGVI